MNDYISKPILPEAVAAALEHWCRPKSIEQKEVNDATLSH
jgi:hypothetical protein